MSAIRQTERERYQRYLCSPEWNALRNAVLDRTNHRCEKCGQEARHVHHLTYIRKYREELADLQALCEQCHDGIHNARLRDQTEIAARRESQNSESGFLHDDPLTRFRGMMCVREYAERAARFGLVDQYSDAVGQFESEMATGELANAMVAKAEIVRIHRVIDRLEGFAMPGNL